MARVDVPNCLLGVEGFNDAMKLVGEFGLFNSDTQLHNCVDGVYDHEVGVDVGLGKFS
jgi:hypothetical protein